MNCLVVVAVALCVLAPAVHCATDSIAWCYNNKTCDDSTWPTIAAKFCSGKRQSPIDILTANVTLNSSLDPFKFVKYDDRSAMATIENTGKTVKMNFNTGFKISGGGLTEIYDSLQFHLHWGNGTSTLGSEHTVNGKRYPMELHIVNSKSSYNRNTTLAVADSEGLAALGFFIEELPGQDNKPESWKTLVSYLTNISQAGNKVDFKANISLDDLLSGVSLSDFYRYLGSLTTPTCEEAVVWTVFKATIKVSKNLIDQFSKTLYIKDPSSPLMVNVYRNIQPSQKVTSPVLGSSTKTSYSVGLMALVVLIGRL